MLLFSCAAPTQAPNDLASVQAALKEKKEALRTLEAEIESLEDKYNELNPSAEKKAVLVTTKKVSKQNFEHFIDAQAVVQSDDVVKLGSEVGGRIINVTVEEGQNVRKGQLIARTDLEAVNKQIAEVESSLSLARDVYERQKRLWDQKIGSEVQYLQAKNNVERLEKTMETLKHQLGKSGIYSPIYGVVDMVFAKAGEVASPGMPIVQILSTNKVKFVADLPENYLGSVKRRDEVEVHIPALDKTMKARVSLIGSTIDPGNRTFKVEASVPNKGGILKPNLLGIMKINDFTLENVLTIPADLLQQEVGGKNFVYTASEDQTKAQKTYVMTGETGNDLIVIEDGLKDGDVLIVEGAYQVTDGDPISVTVEKTASNE